MMDKSLRNITNQAWKREPEIGPPQYRSSTIYEDTTPETLKEFFWDDDFWIKNGWLLQHTTLKECMPTGTMVVQWVRKFPFFCSDREYIIGHRIWESGQTYYCITKVARGGIGSGVGNYISGDSNVAAQSKLKKMTTGDISVNVNCKLLH